MVLFNSRLSFRFKAQCQPWAKAVDVTKAKLDCLSGTIRASGLQKPVSRANMTPNICVFKRYCPCMSMVFYLQQSA